MKSSEENVTPCRHMEALLHRAADNQLTGFAKWYAWAHAKRCGGCLAFLRRLEATSLALRVARQAIQSDEPLERLRRQVALLSADEADENSAT
jgi:hypothetical protein